MNAPKRKPKRPTGRLVRAADESPAAKRRLARATKRAAAAIARSGRREELLKDLPPLLRD